MIWIWIWIGTVDATIESNTSVSLVDIEEHEESMSGIHPDEWRWKYIMAMRGANVVLTDPPNLSLSLSLARSVCHVSLMNLASVDRNRSRTLSLSRSLFVFDR